MIKKQSASEVARGVAPTIIVQTESAERVLKPDQNDDLFKHAARAALSEAVESSFGSVVFGSVYEFIAQGAAPGEIRFVYSWEFTAHSPSGGK